MTVQDDSPRALCDGQRRSFVGMRGANRLPRQIASLLDAGQARKKILCDLENGGAHSAPPSDGRLYIWCARRRRGGSGSGSVEPPESTVARRTDAGDRRARAVVCARCLCVGNLRARIARRRFMMTFASWVMTALRAICMRPWTVFIIGSLRLDFSRDLSIVMSRRLIRLDVPEGPDLFGAFFFVCH